MGNGTRKKKLKLELSGDVGEVVGRQYASVFASVLVSFKLQFVRVAFSPTVKAVRSSIWLTCHVMSSKGTKIRVDHVLAIVAT